MIAFVQNLLTGIDNKTYEITRFGMFVGIIVFCSLSIAKFFLLHSFNEMDFAGGLGVILGFGSGAILLKHKTEPTNV